MANTKINARDWTFEINDGDELEPTLIEIAGVNSMTLGRASEERETTDFDSDGQRESIPMQRHRTVALEGDVIEDDTTGALEPGQARLEALAALVGESGRAEFVATSPGGRTFTQQVWVDPGDQGGGNNDGTSFSYTLVRSGATVIGAAA